MNFPSKSKKIVTADKTIMYLSDNKLHNVEGPALIPQGNPKLAEYYLYGIKYSKKAWLEAKSNETGLPFYKTSVGKSNGARV